MLQKSCSLVLPAPFKALFWLKQKANIHTVNTYFQLHRVPSTVVKHQPRQNTKTWGSNAWGWDTALWWSYPKQGLLLKGAPTTPQLLWLLGWSHRGLKLLLFFLGWILPKETTKGSDEQCPRRDSSTRRWLRTELCLPGVMQSWVGSGAPQNCDS